MRNPQPIPGQKFNMLTIVESVGKIKWQQHVLCKCECGNTKIANWFNVRNGQIKSCGCLRQAWWDKLKVLGKNKGYI